MSIFFLSVASFLPIHFLVIHTSTSSALYNMCSSEIIYPNLLIYWTPVAIYVPKLLFEIFVLFFKPKLRIDKTLKYGTLCLNFLQIVCGYFTSLLNFNPNNVMVIVGINLGVIALMSTAQSVIQLNLQRLVAILPDHFQVAIQSSIATSQTLALLTFASWVFILHILVENTDISPLLIHIFIFGICLIFMTLLTLMSWVMIRRLTESQMTTFYLAQFCSTQVRLNTNSFLSLQTTSEGGVLASNRDTMETVRVDRNDSLKTISGLGPKS